MAIYETQRTIGAWAEATFKHTEIGITAHLLSEAVELYLAAGGKQEEALAIVTLAKAKPGLVGEHVSEEAADVVILARTLANYLGFDLEKAVVGKMNTNRRRKWGEANSLGFTEHIG